MNDALVPIEEQVFFLRRGGLTLNEISTRLEMTVDQVIHLYNKYRKSIVDSRMDRDEAKDLLTARYEGLLSTWYDLAVNGDEDATKHTLSILKDEMKLFQLDQVDPTDRQVTQNILIVGDDRQAFIAALREGRGEVEEGEIMDGEEDEHE